MAQGAPDIAESFREDGPFWTHASHAVERVAEAPLTESDDLTESGEGHSGNRVRAHIGFGALNGLFLRCAGANSALTTATGMCHGRNHTSGLGIGGLVDLSGWAGKTDRETMSVYQS
jgi:hypothetical protein